MQFDNIRVSRKLWGALLGVVLLLALLALYGVWRLLKRLMGPRQ